MREIQIAHELLMGGTVISADFADFTFQVEKEAKRQRIQASSTSSSSSTSSEKAYLYYYWPPPSADAEKPKSAHDMIAQKIIVDIIYDYDPDDIASPIWIGFQLENGTTCWPKRFPLKDKNHTPAFFSIWQPPPLPPPPLPSITNITNVTNATTNAIAIATTSIAATASASSASCAAASAAAAAAGNSFVTDQTVVVYAGSGVNTRKRRRVKSKFGKLSKLESIDEDEEDEGEEENVRDVERREFMTATQQRWAEMIKHYNLDELLSVVQVVNKRIYEINLLTAQNKFKIGDKVWCKTTDGNHLPATVKKYYAGAKSHCIQILVDGRPKTQSAKLTNLSPRTEY
jgi:hypothetical protein